MLENLRSEFLIMYLDNNGLGLLEDEKQEHLPNCRNDNGLLFASYGWAWFKDLITEKDYPSMQASIKILEVGPNGGMLKRRPEADLITDAHDNMDGGIAIDILSGSQSGFAERVCLHGSKFGFQYSNVLHKQWSWKQLRQPGSIAYYKIAAGWVPYPIEMVWLSLGMIYAMCFGWASTHNLAWLKLRTIPVALKRHAIDDSLWGWVKGVWGFTEAVCHGIHAVRSTFIDSWVNYFGPDHIYTRVAQLKK